VPVRKPLVNIVNDLFIVPSASAPIAEGILSRCLVEAETPRDFREIAAVMSPMGIATLDGQRDVIEPPSSIDPGMTLDPPQTGAKMPIVHPPGTTPGSRLILPR